MKRITISVPDELAEAIGRESQRRRVSVSEVARRALEAQVGWRDGERRKLGFANLGRSGHTDTARRAEEILAAEWVPKPFPSRRH